MPSQFSCRSSVDSDFFTMSGVSPTLHDITTPQNSARTTYEDKAAGELRCGVKKSESSAPLPAPQQGGAPPVEPAPAPPALPAIAKPKAAAVNPLGDANVAKQSVSPHAFVPPDSRQRRPKNVGKPRDAPAEKKAKGSDERNSRKKRKSSSSSSSSRSSSNLTFPSASPSRNRMPRTTAEAIDDEIGNFSSLSEELGTSGKPRGYKTKLCKHFLKGSCARGSKCNFVHDEDALRKHKQSNKNKKKEKKSKTNKESDMLETPVKGKRPRAIHTEVDESPKGKGAGTGKGKGHHSPKGSSKGKYSPKGKGNGKGLRNIGNTPPAGLLVNDSSRVPCRFFMEGRCLRGSNCTFFHPGPVEAAEPTRKLTASELDSIINERVNAALASRESSERGGGGDDKSVRSRSRTPPRSSGQESQKMLLRIFQEWNEMGSRQ